MLTYADVFVRILPYVAACYYTGVEAGKAEKDVSNYMCILMLLHMCPHTTAYVSSYHSIGVLILLHMCPHTTTHVSSYYYICVLILLLYRYPHTKIFVSAYYYICVCILLRCGGVQG